MQKKKNEVEEAGLSPHRVRLYFSFLVSLSMAISTPLKQHTYPLIYWLVNLNQIDLT